jgi:hypothetical protein
MSFLVPGERCCESRDPGNSRKPDFVHVDVDALAADIRYAWRTLRCHCTCQELAVFALSHPPKSPRFC